MTRGRERAWRNSTARWGGLLAIGLVATSVPAGVAGATPGVRTGPDRQASIGLETPGSASCPISGVYYDSSGVAHGFLYSDGAYTTINDPNAVASAGGTFGASVNDAGVTNGFYYDSYGVEHGFFQRDGHFTTVDDPSAGTAPGEGTQLWQNADDGSLLGAFIDANRIAHGFIEKDGVFTTITDPMAATVNVPGSYLSGFSNMGTWVFGQENGTIWGFYVDSSGVTHGFTYSGHEFSTVDDPSAPLVPGRGTFLADVNEAGVGLGDYDDSKGVEDGFVDLYGHLINVDDPSAGTSPGQGTDPGVITLDGTVVGSYIVSNGTAYPYIDHGGWYRTLPSPSASVYTLAFDTPPDC
jgi:hypothetical protein